MLSRRLLHLLPANIPLDSELQTLRNQMQLQPSPPLPDTPVMWSEDEASRWIFRRVLELGWTPARFRYYDASVASLDRHAEGGRTERIGKKYQWIALHELLARIADHCRYHEPWADQQGPYEGPWQLSLRDIDPSITFEPVREPFNQSPVTWWQPLSVEIGRFVDHHAQAEWSVADSDVPGDTDLQRLLQVNAS